MTLFAWNWVGVAAMWIGIGAILAISAVLGLFIWGMVKAAGRLSNRRGGSCSLASSP